MSQKTLDPRIFKRSFNWDWSKQRWRGCYLRNDSKTCNYYDLSEIRTNSSKYYYSKDEFLKLILDACSGEYDLFYRAFCNSPTDIRYGDIIQIGKTKNRGMFIVSNRCLIPITQVLGGNGYGEIPLSFVLKRQRDQPIFLPSYWTIQTHPIINIIPVDCSTSPTKFDPTQCSEDKPMILRHGGAIFLDQGLYTISKSIRWDYPYFYVDQSSLEFFSLPNSVLDRFTNAEGAIRDSLIEAIAKAQIPKTKPKSSAPASNKIRVIPVRILPPTNDSDQPKPKKIIVPIKKKQ